MLNQETDQHWVSAHVFTAHPLDLVLSRLVPDVLDESRQRELCDQYFFIRHWQSGPHLRLRLRAASPNAEPELRELLAKHAAAFFQSSPPSTQMTDSQYRALAARLSALEPGSEAGDLAPNDSLAFIDYRPETGKYGHGRALRAVEECFSTCSELALAAVAADSDPAQRLAHCFALLAGVLGPAAHPKARQPSSAVEQYRRRRPALLPVARAARAAASATAETGSDPLTRWFASFRRARDLAADPDRLADHLTHLACNRLGVRLDQEATLRSLAVLAVHDCTSDSHDSHASHDTDADSDADSDD